MNDSVPQAQRRFTNSAARKPGKARLIRPKQDNNRCIAAASDRAAEFGSAV